MGVAYKAVVVYKSMAAMIQFKLANMVDKVGVETMSYTTPIFHIALLDAYGGAWPSIEWSCTWPCTSCAYA